MSNARNEFDANIQLVRSIMKGSRMHHGRKRKGFVSQVKTNVFKSDNKTVDIVLALCLLGLGFIVLAQLEKIYGI